MISVLLNSVYTACLHLSKRFQKYISCEHTNAEKESTFMSVYLRKFKVSLQYWMFIRIPVARILNKDYGIRHVYSVLLVSVESTTTLTEYNNKPRVLRRLELLQNTRGLHCLLKVEQNTHSLSPSLIVISPSCVSSLYSYLQMLEMS